MKLFLRRLWRGRNKGNKLEKENKFKERKHITRHL
jgi:hypothetical protein